MIRTILTVMFVFAISIVGRADNADDFRHYAFVRCSPNPALLNTTLNVEGANKLHHPYSCSLELINSEGRLVQKTGIEVSSANSEFTIQCAAVPAGPYIVRLSTSSTTRFTRLIILH